MAITYSLAPIPKWVIINQQGLPAGGAKLFTYSSLTRQPKAVYADAGAAVVYTNPILFDANGTEGPFYWKYDTAAPDDLYFLEAKDSDDNVLWTIDNYMPQSTGGGGNVTIYQSIVNYIANSAMIDHIDDTASPINSTNLVIAPSNHVGFTPALVNPIVGTWGVVGPDIRFLKDNTTATDQITFVEFAQADNAFSPGDVTPVDYLRYQCTVSPSAETYKCFQFPVCQKVKNLNNQPMTFQCWAKVTANPVTLNVYTRQYFGSGTAVSPEVRTLVGAMALTTSWQEFNIKFTVPSTAGKSIGTPGLQTNDDALYMQLGMPLGAGALCDIQFTKPTLHLGSIEPDRDFDDYDQINGLIQTPRTGDVKLSFLTTANGGWVPMNDGTIGNVGSGATTRANKDTFQLYKTIWDSVSNTWAAVSTGRGATAQADFVAGKTIALTKVLGRALAVAGTGAGLTTRVLGEYLGEEGHVQQPNEVGAHTHTATGKTANTGAGVSDTAVMAGAAGAQNQLVVVASTPAAVAANVMQPTSFTNVFIKL